MTKAKNVEAVERHFTKNGFGSTTTHTSNFIEIIKGENAFVIDDIKGRLL